ncbi:hypothetical protein H6504_01795 [Candidatus Woesearchaeota archaeon]|nr:hypothetical protein [Candidatus Woesearchaeota archaeon]
MEHITMKKAGRVIALLFMLVLMMSSVEAISILTAKGYVFGKCANDTTVLLNLYDETAGGVFVTQVTASETVVNDEVRFYLHQFNGITGSNDYRVDYFVTADANCHGFAEDVAYITTIPDSVFSPNDIDLNFTLQFPFNMTAPSNTSLASNLTQFNWTMMYIDGTNATFRLIVDDDSDFSSPVVNYSTSNFSHTLTSALADDYYYWRIDAFDTSLPDPFIDSSDVMEFQVNEAGVSLSNFAPSNTTYFATSPLTLSFDSDANTSCRFNQIMGSNYSSKTQMDSTGGMTHSTQVFLLVQERNYFYVQCNTSGTISNEYEWSLLYDTIAPSAASAVVQIDYGATYSLDTSLFFNWSGFTDASSGINGYYYNFANLGGSVSPTATSLRNATLNNAAQGVVRVYVWAYDRAGNIGVAVSDSIIVDTQPPSMSGEIWTNLNRHSTGNFVIDVTFTDSSPLLNSAPTIEFQRWNLTPEGPYNMTLMAGSIQSGAQYRYTLPELAAPNEWRTNYYNNLTFTITATDMHGSLFQYNGTEHIDYTITPPVLDPITDKILYQGQTLAFNITASDIDMDPLYYYSNYSSLTVTKINDSIATVTFTPTAEEVGNISVMFRVTDNIFNVTDIINIEVRNVNDAPIIHTTATDYIGYTYRLFNLSINASDPDGDALTYSTNSTLFQISLNGGEIRVYPTTDYAGVHDVNITVEDSNGAEASFVVTITILSCGDAVCSTEYENCNTCSEDCGVCGSKEGSAIIIYPRNCLNHEMKIRAVKLVQRTTCEEQGLIIDGMEVCGNLTDQKITLERVVNATYEAFAELMTDEKGLVTFIPQEEGTYRITLGNGAFQEQFTTKACIEELEDSPAVEADIITNDGTSIKKTVERPEEITPVIEESPAIVNILFFVVIPILSIVLVSLFGRFYYIKEIKSIKEGKKTSSGYVEMVDKKVLMPYAHARLSAEKYISESEFFAYLVAEMHENVQRMKVYLAQLYKDVRLQLKDWGLIDQNKPQMKKMHFLGIEGDEEQYTIAMLLSVNKYLHQWVKDRDLLGRVKKAMHEQNPPYALIDIAVANLALKNVVHFKDNVHYSKGSFELEKMKNALRQGVDYKRHEPTIDDLKTYMRGRTAVLVEIVAADSRNPEKMVKNIVTVVGYDKFNVIIDDYRNNSSRIYVKNEFFMIAWKNAKYRMVALKY